MENRPVAISDNGTIAQFIYDGDSNRVRKTEGVETILYINKYYEKNLTTSQVTTNYYLGSQLIAQRKGTALQYVHQDHLRGTSVISDSSGNQVGNISYFPFGATRAGSVPTDIKFTGQRLDGSGLYYYGARYYDTNIGRFISSDTIVPDPANPQSLNRYSYVFNNPLRYVDYTGHDGGMSSYGPTSSSTGWGSGSTAGGSPAGGMASYGPTSGSTGWESPTAGCPAGVCPTGNCSPLGLDPGSGKPIFAVTIEGIPQFCQRFCLEWNKNNPSLISICKDNCTAALTARGWGGVAEINAFGKKSIIVLSAQQLFYIQELKYQRSLKRDNWTIGLDSTALIADVASVIPVGQPFTFVIGYTASMVASIAQNGRVGVAWLEGKATGFDFVVSTITTVTGAIPVYGAIPAAFQLGYDAYDQGLILK